MGTNILPLHIVDLFDGMPPILKVGNPFVATGLPVLVASQVKVFAPQFDLAMDGCPCLDDHRGTEVPFVIEFPATTRWRFQVSFESFLDVGQPIHDVVNQYMIGIIVFRPPIYPEETFIGWQQPE
jgi:hypothetical protein